MGLRKLRTYEQAKEISLPETMARGDSFLALALAGTEPASVAKVSE